MRYCSWNEQPLFLRGNLEPFADDDKNTRK